MRIQLPKDVDYIIKELQKQGYEAYAVGGCVRDVILGREPEDWDITTSASPMQVKGIFKRTVDTGILHGTVTVMLDKTGYEVTTYRIDGEYEDSRHPKEVTYTPYISEDLMRRDFTINAMAYNEESGLVDIFEGLKDIEEGRIRCVGSAKKRFDEDALRILRAVRFSAQLGFHIEKETLLAAREMAKNLENISAERIRTEINKLLLSPNPDRLLIAYELGITEVVFTEFDRMMTEGKPVLKGEEPLGIFALRGVKLIRDAGSFCGKGKESLILAWAMLLHGLLAEEGKEVLKRLKFDNETVDYVYRLITWYGYEFTLTPYGMRKAANTIGKDLMEMLFQMKAALILAEEGNLLNEKGKKLEEAKELYEEILKKQECIELKDMMLNGKDLIELGFKPGKAMGQVLGELLETVLTDPDLNTRESLIALAAEKILP
ncbi:CCA tRNA nucleotidyltransferase [Anaerocolumna xylanovorans]|uniref:tRNA nucleotidyltransferase (CCA-adding enzyme) n=1 Tax=Anaerocolumna xylanovorans DSM 12503 TaxID=1121345 RepID=A0A1M7YK33_9FIRM|nr:hypothetical protein [Anaerocolumna xylanovorans]SHO52974.1 tRNA nucleotidyltransferase (CCA-adding enzyme) [Anaerocolumna xylanovorans DSM 12503]